jgi:hypothetical protein
MCPQMSGQRRATMGFRLHIEGVHTQVRAPQRLLAWLTIWYLVRCCAGVNKRGRFHSVSKLTLQFMLESELQSRQPWG